MLRFFQPINVDEALTQQQLALSQSAVESAVAAAARDRSQLLRLGPGRPRKHTLAAPVDAAAPAADAAPVESESDESPAKRGKYENWFNTPWIHDILEAYRKTSRSARKAVAQLQLQFPRRSSG